MMATGGPEGAKSQCMEEADPPIHVVQAPPRPWRERVWLLARAPLLVLGIGGVLTAIALRVLWLD